MEHSFLSLNKLSADDLGILMASRSQAPHAFELRILSLFSAWKFGRHNKSAITSLATVLEKQNLAHSSLNAWNKAVRSRPHLHGWLDAALKSLLKNKNIPEFNEFFQSWTSLLEQTYIRVPEINLLEELERNGWNGHGSIGTHENRLRGWIWLHKSENLTFNMLPGSASLAINMIPRGNNADHELYEINEPLPQEFLGFSVRLANGQHLPGSPLISSPAIFKSQGRSSKTNAELTIIIPVYADKKSTLACLGTLFASLKKNRTKTSILVVWDNGPDESLLASLRLLAKKNKIILRETPVNMGFLGAVNYALATIPRGDVLLLNSDTLVHGNWIDRMMEHGRAPDAATVTALGNEAELTSFPSYYNRAKVKNLAQTKILDNAARMMPEEISRCEMPVGVGFCMLITRRALSTIGGFDGRMVCRGYSEETDYCLRAAKAGLKNYCALNVFITHLGGRSFGPVKLALAAQNNATIYKNFPNYEKDYEEFLHSGKIREASKNITKIAVQYLNLPDTLHILPWGAQYLPEWQPGKQNAALFSLPCGKNAFKVMIRLHADFALADLEFSLPDSIEELRDFLKKCSFKHLIAHWHSHPLETLLKALNLDYSLYIDKSSLFPSPGRLNPAPYLIAPPLDVSELSRVCKFANNNPDSTFYMPWLLQIWNQIPMPSNIDWLPDIFDISPLEPAGLIFSNPYFIADCWKEWLNTHHVKSIPFYTLEAK